MAELPYDLGAPQGDERGEAGRPMSKEDREKRSPGLREAALYNRALALMYRSQAAGGADPGPAAEHDLSRALVDATILAEKVVAARIEFDRREGATAAKGPVSPQDQRLQRLADAELPSLMLYAGLLVRTFPKARQAAVKEVVHPPHGKREPLPPDELLKLLPKSPDDDARSAEDVVMLAHDLAPRDPGLASKIVERYVRASGRATARTHYNVACFYTSLGSGNDLDDHHRDGCDRAALAALRMGLQDAAAVGWAQQDPSLQPLHDRRPDEFARIIKDSTPAPHGDKASEPAVAANEGEAEAPDDEHARRDRAFDAIVAFAKSLDLDEQAIVVGPPSTTEFWISAPHELVFGEVRLGVGKPLGPRDVERVAEAAEVWQREREVGPLRVVLLTDARLTPEAIWQAAANHIEVVRVPLAGHGSDRVAD